MHPVIDRTKAAINQHYYLPNFRGGIRTHIKVCKTCQNNKKKNLKYGQLISKEAEAIPWDRLSVDIIDPYTIRI